VEKEIEWTVYIGIPIILLGGAGVTFITKRIEGVIAGLIFAALWPFIWEMLKAAFTTIP
jgi:hypothetical protein